MSKFVLTLIGVTRNLVPEKILKEKDNEHIMTNNVSTLNCSLMHYMLWQIDQKQCEKGKKDPHPPKKKQKAKKPTYVLKKFSFVFFNHVIWFNWNCNKSRWWAKQVLLILVSTEMTFKTVTVWKNHLNIYQKQKSSISSWIKGTYLYVF